MWYFHKIKSSIDVSGRRVFGSHVEIVGDKVAFCVYSQME